MFFIVFHCSLLFFIVSNMIFPYSWLFSLFFHSCLKLTKTKGSKQNWIAACCSGIVNIYIYIDMLVSFLHVQKIVLVHASNICGGT